MHFQWGAFIDSKIASKFEQLWKDTLLLQFHDILPGSSSPEIYDDCYDMWNEMKDDIDQLTLNLLEKVPFLFEENQKNKSKSPCGICKEDVRSIAYIKVINTSNYLGKGILKVDIQDIPELSELDLISGIAIEDPELNALIPCQIIQTNEIKEKLIHKSTYLEFVGEIDSWKQKIFNLVLTNHFKSQKDPDLSTINTVETKDTIQVENQYSSILISKTNGNLISYIDKRFDDTDTNGQKGKQIVKESSNQLNFFRDWAYNEQAWNIGGGYRKMPFEDEELEVVEVKLVENGPVRWAINVKVKILESESIVDQKIIMYKDLPGIYFEVCIDWKQTDTILKNEFTFSTELDTVMAEGPYTSEIITADPNKRSHLEAQRWECCGHTWVSYPDKSNSWGVAYINDSKYGFDVDNSRIGITMVRGPQYPPATGYILEERKDQEESEKQLLPKYTDQGEHVMNYAIIPYIGKWQSSNLPQYAHYYNSDIPMQLKKGSANIGKEPDATKDCPRISVKAIGGNHNLEISAMKTPEDHPTDGTRIIVRIVELSREITDGTISIPLELQIKTVQIIDIIERPMENVKIDVEKDGEYIIKCQLKWKPHEIHTLLLTK
jgi:alpha-mannosidase